MDIPKKDIKGFIPPKLPCIVPKKDIFLTDIIGYGRLKLYLKIYTPKNEILGAPLHLTASILKTFPRDMS